MKSGGVRINTFSDSGERTIDGMNSVFNFLKRACSPFEHFICATDADFGDEAGKYIKTTFIYEVNSEIKGYYFGVVDILFGYDGLEHEMLNILDRLSAKAEYDDSIEQAY